MNIGTFHAEVVKRTGHREGQIQYETVLVWDQQVLNHTQFDIVRLVAILLFFPAIPLFCSLHSHNR